MSCLAETGKNSLKCPLCLFFFSVWKELGSGHYRFFNLLSVRNFIPPCRPCFPESNSKSKWAKNSESVQQCCPFFFLIFYFTVAVFSLSLLSSTNHNCLESSFILYSKIFAHICTFFNTVAYFVSSVIPSKKTCTTKSECQANVSIQVKVFLESLNQISN